MKRHFPVEAWRTTEFAFRVLRSWKFHLSHITVWCRQLYATNFSHLPNIPQLNPCFAKTAYFPRTLGKIYPEHCRCLKVLKPMKEEIYSLMFLLSFFSVRVYTKLLYVDIFKFWKYILYNILKLKCTILFHK